MKKAQIAMQAKIVSSVQEVSSAVQTQAQKGVALRKTATQTERVIQIETIDL